MGQGEPCVRSGRIFGGMSESAPPGELTIDYLKSWEEHGATWKALKLTDNTAVVELCTCYGEAVDIVEGEGERLVQFIRTHEPD